MKIDLLISGGTILAQNKEREIISNGFVAVKDGEIIEIGEKKDQRNSQAKSIIDASGKLVIPGLINSHTHAAMTLFRGLADDLPLEKWLGDYIWPAEAKFINPSSVKVGTMLALAEMIRGGITCFSDMYFFEDEVAGCAKKAGVRGVVCEVLVDFPTANSKSPKKGLEYTQKLLKKWQKDSLIKIAVGPHSIYACSADLLKKSGKLALENNALLHIHLSETEKEVKDSLKKNKKTPLRFLESLGLLEGKVLLAHGVHLTKDEILLLLKRKIAVAHNPESNMKLSSGIAPVAEFLEKGVTVGLGTDGAASNNSLNLFSAMKTAALLQKVIQEDPTVLGAQRVFDLATIYGAKALGQAEKIGSLEKGKKADIVIISLDKPHSIPFYHPVSHLVYTLGRDDVETVIVEGKIIMEKGEIKTFDEEKIKKEAKILAKKISS